MKSMKKGLVIALILIVAGVLVAGAALASVGFDFSALSSVEYVTNTWEIDEPFRSITVAGNTESISFLPSEDGACRVVCRERENEPHRVEAADGTLTIENAARGNWTFFSFSLGTEGPSITVYLPAESSWETLSVQSDTGDLSLPGGFTFDRVQIGLSTGRVDCRASAKDSLSVKTSTGEISLAGLSAETVSLSTSTGRIEAKDVQCAGGMSVSVSTGYAALENVTCGDLTSAGSTGSLSLKSVIASGRFDLRRSTGSISFEGCDAAEISVETDTGSVTGTLLSEKIFQAHSDTGRVDVPKTLTGGLCEVSTDTGSIRLEVKSAP